MKTIKKDYPIVALIGRTNVGKSTIFNKLTEKKAALVSSIPGTTRDRRYGECYWTGKTITLTDTAGLDVESEHDIDLKAVKHAKLAMKEADLVFFVVDARDGLLPQDKEYAMMLKKANKPVILTINKVDSQKHLNQLGDFQKLGFKDIETISAATGAGTGDLLDTVLKRLEEKKLFKNEEKDTDEEEKKFDDHEIKITLLGKPNVGKSSLLNQIVGEEKSIVSEVPHTTRDSQDITIEYVPPKPPKSKNYSAEPYRLTFVDTAGVIKKRKINNALQKMSIEQSMESLGDSNIALLLIDASQPITTQDKNLSSEVLENSKSIIFVVNKWDLVEEKTTHSDNEYIKYLHRAFPFLTWAPIVFIAAKTGFKVSRLIDVIIEVHEKQHQEIDQGQLVLFLHKLLKKKMPPMAMGTKRPYIHSIKQISRSPLAFKVFASQAKFIPNSYKRFIQNELRKHFDFMGCGIKLILSENK
ncbi:ribosome biogenesis GTPase Der [Candidatus Kuenenbacteria bacterium]|nr:ribosome biogenesis GTPase Der [Candidatus Kuenenbacteria bacterium]